MRQTRSGGWRWALTMAGLLATGAGCSSSLTSDSGRDLPEFPTRGIVVKAVNATDQPLDPQFYVGPAADGANRLFVAANRRTDLGVGKVGILLPGQDDSFAVECDDQVLIGTRGGVFGEDLSDPEGRGDPVVLEEGLNIRCGELVTFTFRADGDQLQISLSVEPRSDR